jgi:diadenosine tetraphosphate (Ap4A) HIT family hydrolase
VTSPPGAITSRVDRILRGDDPQFIAETPAGYAILGNQQPEALPGCCMLLPRLPVAAHIDDMPRGDRARFLADFADLGEAVRRATGCERVNYLMLCNHVPEVHAHAIPRFAAEEPAKRLMDPFAAYDFAAARKADATRGPDADLVHRLRDALQAVLAR